MFHCLKFNYVNVVRYFKITNLLRHKSSSTEGDVRRNSCKQCLKFSSCLTEGTGMAQSE
jgi:hypothetical protein